jgi:hypothetical protein
LIKKYINDKNCNFVLLKTYNKNIGHILILCLVLFLVPTLSFACTKKNIKKDETLGYKCQTRTFSDKFCCQPGFCKKDRDHNDCNGKCKHNSCRCGTVISLTGLPVMSDLKIKNHFIEEKKLKFSFSQTYYSSGFSSIWQPPKIG